MPPGGGESRTINLWQVVAPAKVTPTDINVMKERANPKKKRGLWEDED